MCLIQIIRRIFTRTPQQWAAAAAPWSDQHPETYDESAYDRWKNHDLDIGHGNALASGYSGMCGSPTRQQLLESRELSRDLYDTPNDKDTHYLYDCNGRFCGSCLKNTDMEWYVKPLLGGAYEGTYYDSLQHLISAYSARGFTFRHFA